MDCIFYDEALTSSSGWYNSGFTVSQPADDGTLLERTVIGWGTRYANATSSSDTPFSIGTGIEFDLLDVTGQMRFQIIGSATFDYYVSNDANKHILPCTKQTKHT